MIAKGRHATVLLSGKLAVKVFRRGLERNAEKEMRYLKQLEPYGIAPRPLFLRGRVLVMERIEGRPVRDMSPQEVRQHAPGFLRALALLDRLGIKKEESHRPGKHFFWTCRGPRLIDFERAHEGTGNVTQFLAFLRHYFPGIERLGRAYKKTGDLQPLLDFILSS